ncbi:hypothetical protein GOP47_0003173 [Adiantum capillus-veneris]|uniref:mRNA (guanine-N(7))-methyltransferase n=1 Tax=Adiantum capillus-veneris TaxID=13818 RepID=A0A9D4VBG7_ADICA|nr:hypothetical protein GOP47_0003173 [Adiantum capillus-veneris]
MNRSYTITRYATRPSLISSAHVANASSQGDIECYQHVIAQHYRQRCNRTLEEREASPIIHLKKLHNWIKEVLIRMYAQKGNVVLDMACGKGGDLAKWYKAEVRLYVGVDIVESSLQQARKRYQELTIKATNNHTTRHTYVVNLHYTIHGHPWGELEQHLQISSGGEFGNRLYKVKFERQQHAKALRYGEDPYGLQYEFHLEDAVNHCPEWLVPFDELKNLAQQYGLELSLKKNFHEFVKEHMQVPNLVELMHKLDAQGTISSEEWECVSIYLVFVFRKRSH